MEKGYKILGNYIRLVDERNKDLSVTKLLGVSISKKFIPSIANIVGTDLSNYKIVRTGQFAYGTRYFTKWRKNLYCLFKMKKIVSFQALIQFLKLKIKR